MATASYVRDTSGKNFSVLNNFNMWDGSLSCQAKGLLHLMLSVPPDWDFSVTGFAAILKEGKYAVRKMLNELEEHGYLTREPIRNADGTFVDVRYTIYEHPIIEPKKSAKQKKQEKQKLKQSPKQAKNKKPFFGQPKANNPKSGNPKSKKQTQLNTNQNKELKEVNTNSMAMKALTDRFGEFWAVCPKKRDRQECFQWWAEHVGSEELAERIIKGMAQHAQSEEWTKDHGKWIPRPINWLSDERWDEILTVKERSYDIDRMETSGYFAPIESF